MISKDHPPKDIPLQKPWAYLETEPAPDAPVCDNPSGYYCRACREAGHWHCSAPEYCGGLRMMKPKPQEEVNGNQDNRTPSS